MKTQKNLKRLKDDDLLTREEIAAYLGINMTTLATWLAGEHKFDLESADCPGRKLKYYFRDVKVFQEMKREQRNG